MKSFKLCTAFTITSKRKNLIQLALKSKTNSKLDNGWTEVRC